MRMWATLWLRGLLVLGFRLFLHALRMVLGNFGAALRISAPAIAIYAVSTVMIMAYAPELQQTQGAERMPGGGMQMPFEGMEPGLALVVVGLGILSAILFLAVAVAWHRYILLEESPGALGPRWNGGAMWGYFVASLALGLVVLFAAIPVMIVAAMVILPLAGAMQAPLVGTGVFMLAVYVPLVIVFYRIAPIMPSAAIGRRMGISEAWNATRGAGGAVLVLALVSVLGIMALSAPIYALTQLSPMLGTIWELLAGWFQMLMGVSILSTLYGYFIEKRDLNA